MSDKHLGQGSSQPPKVEGKWRLYSMLYCPYAQRARLVLHLKGVPHDIVNIDLKNKPDWFLKISPTGKVPLLDTGSDLVTASLDICDFIDSKYPNPPLYNADEKSIEEDKNLIKSFDALIALFYQAVWQKTDKPLKEHLDAMKPLLQKLDKELEKRGKFFGGDSPKMADYMLWPYAERATLVGLAYKETLPVKELGIPLLLKWYKEMEQQLTVQELRIPTEKHYNLLQRYVSGEKFNYDDI